MTTAHKRSPSAAPELVQSLDRALTLLESLASGGRDMSLKELSRSVGLSSSMAYRILSTLQVHGLVQEDSNTRQYGPGLKLLQPAGALRNQLDLRKQARPFLERLARDSGETFNLVVLDGYEAVYIDQGPSKQPLPAFAKIGARVPLHCTGVGKVLLAAMKPEARAAVLKQGLPALTDDTITHPYRLEKVLGEVREQGFALDLEERQEQVKCVAAPMFDDEAKVIAAVSISGPAHRLVVDRITQLVPLVRQAARAISAELGYQVEERTPIDPGNGTYV